jgi:hypothetical protein
MTDGNIQENQQDKPSNEVVIVPFIEENIPIPKNAREALPSMTSEDEVMLRAQTIKEVSDIMGEEIAPNAENAKEAEDLARKMVENPGMKQEYGLYANETVAYLGGLVGCYNHMIVKDLADLKLYVVNKLVEIVHHEDSNLKERITALRSIGEVDGVDARGVVQSEKSLAFDHRYLGEAWQKAFVARQVAKHGSAKARRVCHWFSGFTWHAPEAWLDGGLFS